MKSTELSAIQEDLKQLVSGHAIIWTHQALIVDRVNSGGLVLTQLEADTLVELRAFNADMELHVKHMRGELYSMIKTDDNYSLPDRNDNYLDDTQYLNGHIINLLREADPDCKAKHPAIVVRNYYQPDADLGQMHYIANRFIRFILTDKKP